jgi:hypothetical protein
MDMPFLIDIRPLRTLAAVMADQVKRQKNHAAYGGIKKRVEY